HDLTGEPKDRSKYLADAHVAPSSLPGLDSSEARERAACARGPHPRQRQLSQITVAEIAGGEAAVDELTEHETVPIDRDG
ncbi:MAG: hypothetical protein WHS89_13100, partial [Acidimicrobiales bacterium]